MSASRKKEIIGYEMENGNIYCVECIKKNYPAIRGQIEDAITADDLAENEYVCVACKEEIK